MYTSSYKLKQHTFLCLKIAIVLLNSVLPLTLAGLWLPCTLDNTQITTLVYA